MRRIVAAVVPAVVGLAASALAYPALGDDGPELTPPAVAGQPPFGAPFALPDEGGEETPFGGAAEPSTGFGWAWEPPEDDLPPQP